MTIVFKILNILPKALRKLVFIFYALSTRAMTLGVRVVVQNEAGEVLLVRHTYVEGWHLPGGGVERGETLAMAARKELLEECGIKAGEKVEHIHTYKNNNASRFDHVALFRCHDWSYAQQKEPDGEIAEIAFFPLDDVPPGTTRYTSQRLLELFGEEPFSDIW